MLLCSQCENLGDLITTLERRTNWEKVSTNAGERTGKRMKWIKLPASQSLEELVKMQSPGFFPGNCWPRISESRALRDGIIDKPQLSQLRACDFGQVTWLGFSELQFPHLWNQDANAHFSGFLWELNEIIHIKRLPYSSTQGKGRVDDSVVLNVRTVVSATEEKQWWSKGEGGDEISLRGSWWDLC